MPNAYAIRTVVFASGERCPILIHRHSGEPLFEANVFALTQFRSRNRASATIDQALRAVMLFCLYLDGQEINIQERMLQGQLLSGGEIEALVGLCRLPLSSLGDVDKKSGVGGLALMHRGRPTESQRRQVAGVPSEVDTRSFAIRLDYICEYVQWLGTERLTKLGANSKVRSDFEVALNLTVAKLKGQFPLMASRKTVGLREGLSEDSARLLAELIEPDSRQNPWKGAHPRLRNQLAVIMLWRLGLRRGELLGLRIEDFNFQKNEVLIARRADDVTDPRRYQPNAKTSDRLLALDDGLAKLIWAYVIGLRRQIPGARTHDFLFVANGSGAPLTLVAINKIFTALRDKCPELPEALTPHVLRHTWNDDFSRIMDEKGVAESEEQKMRSYQMGWSEASGTAATYTRRHTRTKANAASMELQRKLKRVPMKQSS